MYSSFVLYLPEDGQMVGRSMYEVTVLYKLISKHLCASVGTAYINCSINARVMDHKGAKCGQGKKTD
jgi:hypothetical protein